METVNSHRPWEAEKPNMHSKGPQTLPSISTLTANINNQPSERSPLSNSAVSRDSGPWQTPQSAVQGSSIYAGSAGIHPSSSPNRFSGNSYSGDAPTSAVSSPTYNSNMQHQPLPSLNQTFDPTHPRVNGAEYEESRRSSIDSRMNQGMIRLALEPVSPYASANASQTSLVSVLQKERGIQSNSYRGPRYSSASGPLSPLGPRNSKGGFAAGRVAPPIMENPRSEVYNAPLPTAGQPYAFPDPDLAKPDRPGSTFSRRNSYADSFSSSIFTQDSRLPQGQQELPDGTTHHHSLQNKQVRSVIDEGDSPNSNTPYSRTPELRVTHKLAERKRRSEMKGCFEALRQRLPAGQTNKSSKWETLSRAIDYITSLENSNSKYRNDLERLNQQHNEMDMQMKEMMQQIQKLQQQQSGPGSYETPPNAISPMFPNHNHNQFGNGAEPPRTLPPLLNGVAMQGVQYGDDRR